MISKNVGVNPQIRVLETVIINTHIVFVGQQIINESMSSMQFKV